MKAGELRLKGSGFTMRPVSKKHDIPFYVSVKLLKLIYEKSGINSKDDYCISNISGKREQNIPTQFDKRDLEKFYFEKEAIIYGLMEKNKNKYEFTKLALRILSESLEIQRELEKRGFYEKIVY